jgi:hypothetical protein
MAAVAAVQAPVLEAVPADFLEPFIVQEDSTLMKVFSCIPILGMIPSMIQEVSLANKAGLLANRAQLLEVIKVKNQYKVANIIRNVLDIALIVAGIALGIISRVLGVFLIILTVVNVLNIADRIAYNKTVINELQIRGFRPRMKIG